MSLDSLLSSSDDLHSGFQVLFQSHPLPMWIYDLDTLAFLAVNVAAVKTYGYSEAEFLEKTLRDIRPPESVPRLMENLRGGRSRREQSAPWVHEYRDGTQVNVEITSHTLSFREREAVLVVVRDITEHVQARRRLEQSERRYRGFVEHCPVGIYRTTPAGEVQYANPALLRMLGFDRLEALRTHQLDDDAFPDADRAAFQAAIARDGEVRHWETRWRRADGSAIDVRESARRVDTEDGPVYEGVVEDVTKERRMKEELRRSEETYRSIINEASDAIYVQDRDGTFLDSNRAAAENMGLEPGELVGRTPADLAAPGRNDLARLREQLAEAFDGTPQRTEFWAQRADGSVFPKDVRLQPGTYFGRNAVIAFARDITHQKETESRLRRRNEVLQSIIDTVPVMLTFYDASLHFFQVNAYWRKVLGYTLDEIHAMDDPMGEFFPENALREEIQTFMKDAPDTWMDVTMKTRDGETVETTWTNVTLSDDTHIGIGIDITQRKGHEKVLLDAKEEAEEAARLKAAMLANMSHEVRTPLTSILGFTEVLQEEETDAQKSHFLSLVHRSGLRLLATIDSVMELSKLEAGGCALETESVDVSAQVRSACEEHAFQAEDDAVALRADLPAGACRCEADEAAVHRILDNLIGNALKFTPPGGQVCVRARNAGRTVRLTVADTGIGMDASFQKRMFQAFTQESEGLRRSHEGSGLGLAIVHKLVQFMHGTVAVDSAPGEGTRITVTLPASNGFARGRGSE